MIGDRNCIPFRAFLVAKQHNTLTDNTCPSSTFLCLISLFLLFSDIITILLSTTPKFKSIRYLLPRFQLIFFFFLCLTFLNEIVSVLVLSLLKSILSREGTHGLPLRCTLKPTCTKPLTRYLSVNVFSFFIFF